MRKPNYRKKIVWGTVFLLILVGAIFCKIRWRVWFGNQPEIKFVLTDQPQRVSLTFGNTGELSRRVSWACGGTSGQARLEYVEDGATDTIRLNGSSKYLRSLGGYTNVNWAKFGELSYGRSYHYRVCNDSRVSDWYSFSMPSDTAKKFSFVFIGDIQDTLHGTTRPFMENIRHRYPQAAFYLFVGDFAERPMNCYWEEAYHSIDSIATNTPIVASPGNHEYIKGLTRIVEKRFAYFFSYLLESRYKGNNVYAMDYKNATVITLDSNRDPWFLRSQRAWLKKTLQSSTKKWKIVMLHHPVYSIKGRMNNLIIRWMFDDLFREYGVDLVLQGHEHNYGRMTAKTDDGQPTTPVYLVSHASPKTYRLSFNPLYDRFGTNHRFYQIIDVAQDSLIVKTFLENDSLYDHLSILKKDANCRIMDYAKAIPEQLDMPWLSGKKARKYQEKVQEWRNRKQ